MIIQFNGIYTSEISINTGSGQDSKLGLLLYAFYQSKIIIQEYTKLFKHIQTHQLIFPFPKITLKYNLLHKYYLSQFEYNNNLLNDIKLQIYNNKNRFLYIDDEILLSNNNIQTNILNNIYTKTMDPLLV